MLNAWPCIGPGTAEREGERCCSCLDVVSHEAGSLRIFAGRRSFARGALQGRGCACCMLSTRSGQLPGLDIGFAHAGLLASSSVEIAWASRTSPTW